MKYKGKSLFDDIDNDFNIEIPYWRDSLKDCILKIYKNKTQ